MVRVHVQITCKKVPHFWPHFDGLPKTPHIFLYKSPKDPRFCQPKTHFFSGVLITFVLVGTCAVGNLKMDPSKYQFLKKKWPINIPIDLILGQILTEITQFLSNFLTFEPILVQIWVILKFNPFKYQILPKMSHWYEADLATHDCSTSRKGLLYTEYPQGIFSCKETYIFKIFTQRPHNLGEGDIILDERHN